MAPDRFERFTEERSDRHGASNHFYGDTSINSPKITLSFQTREFREFVSPIVCSISSPLCSLSFSLFGNSVSPIVCSISSPLCSLFRVSFSLSLSGNSRETKRVLVGRNGRVARVVTFRRNDRHCLPSFARRDECTRCASTRDKLKRGFCSRALSLPRFSLFKSACLTRSVSLLLSRTYYTSLPLSLSLSLLHVLHIHVRVYMKFQDIQRKIFILRVKGPSDIVYAEFQLYAINRNSVLRCSSSVLHIKRQFDNDQFLSLHILSRCCSYATMSGGENKYDAAGTDNAMQKIMSWLLVSVKIRKERRAGFFVEKRRGSLIKEKRLVQRPLCSNKVIK